MQASSLFAYDKVNILPRKTSAYGKQVFILEFHQKLSKPGSVIKVTADRLTKEVKIVDGKQTVLSLVGKGSFQEVDFINADGECIGCGSYKELPNMPAKSAAGLKRTYNVYKSNNQNFVAHFYQVHNFSSGNFIRLTIDQPQLDCFTRTLLVGKLIMMALLDPGFVHTEPNASNESQCITKIAASHILPNFILPDWDYPAQLRMRIFGTIVGEKDKRDYYVLFDPLGKPWYIMETNKSTELKVLDPVTFEPLLIGDNAGSFPNLCTITTHDKTVIGKIEGRKLYVNFDDGFRNVYKSLIKANSETASFSSLGDSRYRHATIISKCEADATDEKEITITLNFPTHRLGWAVLLPAFCLLASQRYETSNIQVPVSQNVDDLRSRLEIAKV